MKKNSQEPLPSLAELEGEAEAYGRQVARQYLQEKLQQLAETHGEVFPPKPETGLASAVAKAAPQDNPGRS